MIKHNWYNGIYVVGLNNKDIKIKSYFYILNLKNNPMYESIIGYKMNRLNTINKTVLISQLIKLQSM